MKTIITILGLVMASVTVQADDNCKAKLEREALAAFAATEFNVADMAKSAQADLTGKYPTVRIFQYRASFLITYQIKDGNQALCEIQGSTQITEERN